MSKEKKKILFLVAHRLGRSPGQRFRFEQYLDYLGQNGFECHISNLIDERDDADFYAKGKYLAKFRIFIKSFWRRLQDLRRLKEYHAVFLYREAFMLGNIFFEKAIHRRHVPMILDFDDSIWLHDVSIGNKNLGWLKDPLKTEKIIRLCDLVIVGNQYLADYALRYNPNVHVIPTTIDTDYYVPGANSKPENSVCIGWTGSTTTLKHFSLATGFLERLKEKYKEGLSFRLIADRPYENSIEGLEFVKWRKESEVKDLLHIDIGIMPLPDDAWSRGKCGFKGLQYMSLEIPAVLSPVGVNKDIITDGENGFLASTTEEWFDILCRLIESPELRKQIGKRGRQTVVERFSFDSQKERYISLLNTVCLKVKKK